MEQRIGRYGNMEIELQHHCQTTDERALSKKDCIWGSTQLSVSFLVYFFPASKSIIGNTPHSKHLSNTRCENINAKSLKHSNKRKSGLEYKEIFQKLRDKWDAYYHDLQKLLPHENLNTY